MIGFILILVLIIVLALPTAIRRMTCKHSSYYEVMSCHGICMSCHKDLGFIGTLRDDKTKTEVWLGQPWK